MYNVERFIAAQDKSWEQVMKELKLGKKETHWIWYVFPQIKGFSWSKMGQYYAISNLEEANEYFNNEILRERLMESLTVLLGIDSMVEDIFDDPDDLKFISFITLFHEATGHDIFLKIIEHFEIEMDECTLIEIEKTK